MRATADGRMSIAILFKGRPLLLYSKPANGPPLLVELWRVTPSVARWLIVVNPQLRMVFCEDARNLFHRRYRLRLVIVEAGNAPIVPIGLKMHGIARQHDITRLLEMDEQ